MAAFRAPVCFISSGLIFYRQRNCTLQYYCTTFNTESELDLYRWRPHNYFGPDWTLHTHHLACVCMHHYAHHLACVCTQHKAHHLACVCAQHETSLLSCLEVSIRISKGCLVCVRALICDQYGFVRYRLTNHWSSDVLVRIASTRFGSLWRNNKGGKLRCLLLRRKRLYFDIYEVFTLEKKSKRFRLYY